MNRYDPIVHQYASFVNDDPVLRYVSYPFILDEIGAANDKHALDVGCGEGTLARLLASKGASVVGYDRSSKQIAIAKQREHQHPFGIDYFISDPRKFKSTGKFDDAVSVMSLPYAPSRRYLALFFSSTCKLLKNGGVFISVVRNPDFSHFNEFWHRRRYTPLKNKKVKVEFFDRNNKFLCSATSKNFSQSDYETGAHDGGFSNVSWRMLKPNPEGIKRFGAVFWKKYLTDPPHVGFIAWK